MTFQLTADFRKEFLRGPVIEGQLSLPTREFSVTVLFGPSGCGKTTWLRCLAGLERPSAGRIQFESEVWFDAQQRRQVTPQARQVGYLFQNLALFPHLTVAQNIAFTDPRSGLAQNRDRWGAYLQRFELEGLESRYPHQLSGGQQQRVALARTLFSRPRLLLLDEPLSALDVGMRDQVRHELRHILAEFAIPVVLVTHDRTEAIALGDQMVVISGGRVLQQGTVPEVFARPANAETARIVGMETILAGEIQGIENGLALVRVGARQLLAVAPDPVEREVHVCIKGEDVMLLRGGTNQLSVRNHLPARVCWLSPEGALVRVGLDCGFDLTALITRAACEELQVQPGAELTALVKAPAVHLLPRHRHALPHDEEESGKAGQA